MLQKVHFSTFLIVFLLLSQRVCSQTFYGGQIHVTAKIGKQLAPTISDLQYHLQKISSDSIKVDYKDTTWQHGICLIKLDRRKDSLYDSRLDRFNSDMFLLRSDGISAMNIIAYSTAGLTNGIYTYLDLLGFRWFHPGDVWTHIPDRKDGRLKIDSVFAPDFLLRGFFGSFGTPRNEVIDKPQYVHKQWMLWQTRNRQGGDYNLRGHEWNNFLWRNLDTLKAHPEFMALVDSHRVKPASAAKFCVSNKSMREHFVAFEVGKLKKEMAAHPDEDRYFISVEPSDGYGDCQCDSCKKMGSYSTRVFILANETAKAFKEISPVAGVNLLAYNTHADTPNVVLESNVLVQVVPYKYQRYTSPDSMLQAWEMKKDTLFMYDYYGLPILNVDMPLKGGLKPAAYAKRVQYWYKNKIRGVYLETSCSIGSTGLGLYLYTRLGWNVHSPINKLIEEYYTLNYGKAAKDMREAQELLTDTIDSRLALYNAIHVIKSNINESRLDPGQRERVVTYKAYLHYLKLLYDFKRFDKKLEPQTSDSLIRYAHSIFTRMLVSHFPLIEHMWTYGPTSAYIRKYWDVYHPAGKNSKYPTVVQWTDAQVEAAFDEDYKQLREALPKKDRPLPGKRCCEDTEEDTQGGEGAKD